MDNETEQTVVVEDNQEDQKEKEESHVDSEKEEEIKNESAEETSDNKVETVQESNEDDLKNESSSEKEDSSEEIKKDVVEEEPAPAPVQEEKVVEEKVAEEPHIDAPKEEKVDAPTQPEEKVEEPVKSDEKSEIPAEEKKPEVEDKKPEEPTPVKEEESAKPEVKEEKKVEEPHVDAPKEEEVEEPKHEIKSDTKSEITAEEKKPEVEDKKPEEPTPIKEEEKSEKSDNAIVVESKQEQEKPNETPSKPAFVDTEKEVDGVIFKEFSISLSNKNVVAHSWTNSASPKALILFYHGLHAHTNPETRPGIAELAIPLAKQGFYFFTYDQFGHGKTPTLTGSELGLMEHFPIVLQAALAFVDKITAEYPQVPFLVAGESFGGVMALNVGSVLQKSKSDVKNLFKGEFLIAPALETLVTPSAPVVAMLKVAVKVGPAWALGPMLDPDHIWRTAEAKAEGLKDPLRYGRKTKLQTGFSFKTAMDTIVKQINDIEFPFFVMHGTADKTIPLVASEKLFNKAKSQDKKINKYEGACHDLLHDPDTKQVLGDILEWVSHKFQ